MHDQSPEEQNLSRVRDAVCIWRASRPSPKSRMPEELWEATLSCVTASGTKKTASSVGLDPRCIEKRIRRTRTTSKSTPEAKQCNFIEIPPISMPCSKECRIELSGKNGFRMHIELKGSELKEELAQLVQSFTQLNQTKL